jgi:hypothetical protein
VLKVVSFDFAGKSTDIGNQISRYLRYFSVTSVLNVGYNNNRTMGKTDCFENVFRFLMKMKGQ